MARRDERTSVVLSLKEAVERALTAARPLLDGLRFDAHASTHGERGAAVHVPSRLHAKATSTFAINQFNLIASELVSVNRALPDERVSA